LKHGLVEEPAAGVARVLTPHRLGVTGEPAGDDLVFEGEARRVADTPTLKAIAAL
jgi:hypothetical protein